MCLPQISCSKLFMVRIIPTGYKLCAYCSRCSSCNTQLNSLFQFFIYARAYLTAPVFARQTPAPPLTAWLNSLALLVMRDGFGESGVCRPAHLVSGCFTQLVIGILPIIQWLISLEKNPPPTRNLHTIERLQGWSMLAFYPLEQLGYLVSHSIIPPSLPSLRSLLSPFSSSEKERVRVNEAAVGLWSTRLWALYVALQIAHLREDRQILKARTHALRKAKGKGPPLNIEREELRKKWDAHWNEWAVNLSYLPLTIHWYAHSPH